MKAPCYKCKDRHPCCHDTCARYKAFKQDMKALRDCRVRENAMRELAVMPKIMAMKGNIAAIEKAKTFYR